MSLQVNGDDYVRVPLHHNEEVVEDSENELQGFIEEPVKSSTYSSESPNSIWNFKFYQQHFDVDTHQVLRRLAYALMPNPRTRFVQHVLRPHADLYGPFWIATTLILAAAIGGNVSSYLQSRGRVTSWRYDFRKVTLASTIIYMYWWLIPLGLTAFAYMRSKRAHGSDENEDENSLLSGTSRVGAERSLPVPKHKFADLLSVYGYSLAVFVPVSILWIIPSSALQWLLVAIAMTVSSAFLAFALFPLLRKDHPKLTIPLLVGLIILHCLFCAGLMITFFHSFSSNSSVVVNSPVLVAPIDNNVAAGVVPPPAELNSGKVAPKVRRDISMTSIPSSVVQSG